MNKTLIIIPAFNESETIDSVINALYSANSAWDIVVVNDGSTDNTSELAKSTAKAIVIDLPYNLGIGGAVQTGFKYAVREKYQYAIQVDGDGQHSVDDVAKVLKIVHSGEADVGIGSRFNSKFDKNYGVHWLRRLGIWIFKIVSLILIRQKITDHTSGFRAYNARAFHFLSNNYPIDFPEPEVIILLGRNGFTIKEVFTQMQKRQGGISSIPICKGPYYMSKVLLSMIMASLRRAQIKK
ncbi:MAG: glycosyltransferase family 2 protein [Bacteroidia bacterium]|nr:glycosyltransferase family 2 protein [Bacteroidia bacterium]